MQHDDFCLICGWWHSGIGRVDHPVQHPLFCACDEKLNGLASSREHARARATLADQPPAPTEGQQP